MSPGDLTSSALVAKWAAINAESPAIIDTSGTTISYQELSGIISSWKQALARQGIGNGSRIAVVLPNGSDMAVAFLGVTSVATCAPLNSSYSMEEFSFYLQDTGCDGLLVSANHPTAAEEAALDLAIPCHRLRSIRETLSGASPIIGEMPPREQRMPSSGSHSHPDDYALILHTSGTTGKPKRVPLRQDRICRSAAAIAGSLHLTRADRCLNLMPLFHVHGLIGCLLATLYSGGAIITTPGFQPDRVAAWLHDLKPTWYSAVPAIHHSLLRVLRNDEELHHHLRFIRSCSAPLAPSLLKELEEQLHVPVIEAYGMTEASHQIASNPLPPALHKPGSVGIPTGYTIKIQDQHGRDCNPSIRGDVWIRGENLFSGYEDNPVANSEEFMDGFFRTGDEGFIDPDGYLHLTGRIKELINKGGEKVAPREIEEVFLRYPGIDQAVALGIPHGELGEDIGLIVVPNPGHEPAKIDLKNYALKNLAPWKVPSKIHIMNEIPKGPTGKVRRRELAALLSDLESHLEPPHHHPDDEKSSGLEKQIQIIWENTLQRGRIGLDDDFFSIGGYSLTALSITTELERTFQVDLPPTILFSAPTIRQLAAVIERKRSGQPFPVLIPFNEKGNRPPIFLVPPGQGNAFFFRDFAGLLGSDQPFYSFSWFPIATPPRSIESIAARYNDEILKVHPSGPFIVGGYCFGAVVALEMTHQLQDRGRAAHCLVIIDPDSLPNGPGWTWEPKRQTRKEFLLWFIKGGPRRWYWFTPLYISRKIRPPRLTQEQQKQLEKILANTRMLREYYAKPYKGLSIVFHQEKADELMREQWKIILGELAESQVIPGTNHNEVLEKGGRHIADNVRDFSDPTC